MKRYLVAGSRPWSRQAYDQIIRHYPGTWRLIAGSEQLTLSTLRRFKPDAIFFLHWSWTVPGEVVDGYECVGFHMTDLPYGRGGSPLQNLIRRGHRRTKLTAFRMISGMDAGPVYAKEDLSLDGPAEAIYRRASRLAARMIRRLIQGRIVPVSQRGKPVIFARRQPAQSRMPAVSTAARLYDFIRMLDAEGYPRAFLESRGFRYEFSQARLGEGGRILAHVQIAPVRRAWS